MIRKKVGVSVVAILIASMVMGCVPSETPSPTPSETGEFSIYLLADEVPASQPAEVDLSDLQLQEEPIVSAEDITMYSKESHEIELTADAYQRIQQLFVLPVQVQGIPFVACVGADRIYAGAFWTPASSISFDGVVICEPFDVDGHVISIVLGYPAPEAFTGQDPRSDPRVFESLEALGKLR